MYRHATFSLKIYHKLPGCCKCRLLLCVSSFLLYLLEVLNDDYRRNYQKIDSPSQQLFSARSGALRPECGKESCSLSPNRLNVVVPCLNEDYRRQYQKIDSPGQQLFSPSSVRIATRARRGKLIKSVPRWLNAMVTCISISF